MRTFIALELDKEIKDNLTQFIQKLNKGTKSIKWVKPEGMHLTLKFLGEISEEESSFIKSALNKISLEFRPFSLKFKGTGTFPPGKKIPRVLWVGLEKVEPLLSLQARVEKEMENLQFPREKRKFHPHLTLGRVKKRFNLQETLQEFNKYNQVDFGEMEVDRIVFYKSSLKPSGAEYTKLSEHELK